MMTAPAMPSTYGKLRELHVAFVWPPIPAVIRKDSHDSRSHHDEQNCESLGTSLVGSRWKRRSLGSSMFQTQHIETALLTAWYECVE